jgi:hypothetical protein
VPSESATDIVAGQLWALDAADLTRDQAAGARMGFALARENK